jgi:hypothetical protein
VELYPEEQRGLAALEVVAMQEPLVEITMDLMELQILVVAAAAVQAVQVLVWEAQAAPVLSSSRSTNKYLWKPKSTDFSA